MNIELTEREFEVVLQSLYYAAFNRILIDGEKEPAYDLHKKLIDFKTNNIII